MERHTRFWPHAVSYLLLSAPEPPVATLVARLRSPAALVLVVWLLVSRLLSIFKAISRLCGELLSICFCFMLLLSAVAATAERAAIRHKKGLRK